MEKLTADSLTAQHISLRMSPEFKNKDVVVTCEEPEPSFIKCPTTQLASDIALLTLLTMYLRSLCL